MAQNFQSKVERGGHHRAMKHDGRKNETTKNKNKKKRREKENGLKDRGRQMVKIREARENDTQTLFSLVELDGRGSNARPVTKYNIPRDGDSRTRQVS